jgi:hypothetical protein
LDHTRTAEAGVGGGRVYVIAIAVAKDLEGAEVNLKWGKGDELVCWR